MCSSPIHGRIFGREYIWLGFYRPWSEQTENLPESSVQDQNHPQTTPGNAAPDAFPRGGGLKMRIRGAVSAVVGRRL